MEHGDRIAHAKPARTLATVRALQHFAVEIAGARDEALGSSLAAR
jgi:hypothetical protein